MSILVRGNKLHFDDRFLHVELEDGRAILTPMEWYPELQKASFEVILNYSFICHNTEIVWPDIDYQLSIERMFATPHPKNK